MTVLKAKCVLLLLVSAFCLATADKVAQAQDQELASSGHGRGLTGVLGALLLKKVVVAKALVTAAAVKLVLSKALLLKAHLILLKLKALGLGALLLGAGVNQPEDVVYATDLGSTCNVALDMGISCAELAKDEPQEVKDALSKMHYKVYYVVEEAEVVVEHPPVETWTCVVEHEESSETKYYIVVDDGPKKEFKPTKTDVPVEYVIVHEDGHTEPYYGPVEVITEKTKPEEGEVEYIIKNHKPEKREDDEVKDKKEEKEEIFEVALPKEVTVKDATKIATDTIKTKDGADFVRYKRQEDSDVYETEALAAFKMALLSKMTENPEFEKRDGIYVAKMLQ